MSLVSNLFLLFVAASVLVYYIVPHKFQWLVLLCFSYIYYLAGGVRYVGFLLFSTLVTWLIALILCGVYVYQVGIHGWSTQPWIHQLFDEFDLIKMQGLKSIRLLWNCLVA